jgi:hypothetical protein
MKSARSDERKTEQTMAGEDGERCGYECPVCGGGCCAGRPRADSGLCPLHDPALGPSGREAAARAAGARSLADWLESKAARGEVLYGAILSWAELERAQLAGADLRGAQLNEARLQRADLSEARLEGANLYNADLREAWMRRARLNGACLDWAKLGGARGLRSQDCGRIRATVPGYRSVKRMFQEADQREAASAYAFREKRQQRRDLWARRREWFRSAHGVRRFGQWLVHCVLEGLCGYFENYVLPLLWSLAIIVFCAVAYTAGDGIEPAPHRAAEATRPLELNDGLYFSAVTFTTLGYGDFRPRPGGWRLVAGAEAFAGAFLISVFVVTLAHRYVVR